MAGPPAARKGTRPARHIPRRYLFPSEALCPGGVSPATFLAVVYQMKSGPKGPVGRPVRSARQHGCPGNTDTAGGPEGAASSQSRCLPDRPVVSRPPPPPPVQSAPGSVFCCETSESRRPPQPPSMSPSQLALPLLLLASGVAAQKIRVGPCPDLEPVSDFDISAYSGLWYENRRLKTAFQAGQKCVTTRYSDDLGGFIAVTNTGYLLNKRLRVYGYAFATNGTEVGAFAVGFPEPQDKTRPNYNVIEVEYDRYAVVYHCSNLLGGASHSEFLWLLTRQPNFPKQEARQIVWNLMKRGIFLAFEMTKTDQTCPDRSSIFDIEFEF